MQKWESGKVGKGERTSVRSAKWRVVPSFLQNSDKQHGRRAAITTEHRCPSGYVKDSERVCLVEVFYERGWR